MTDFGRTPERNDRQPTTARADLLIANAAQVLTCAPGAPDRLGRIDNASVAVAGERIVAVGTAARSRPTSGPVWSASSTPGARSSLPASWTATPTWSSAARACGSTPHA